MSTILQKIMPYVHLGRYHRPIGVWLCFFPSIWGLILQNETPLSLFQFFQWTILFLIGAWTVRGAGCTINDIWDRHLDKNVERTKNRPLANGELNVYQAVIFAMAQLFIAFCVFLTLYTNAKIAAVILLVLSCIYPLMKRITHWPQAFLGLVMNAGFWVGIFNQPTFPARSFIPLFIFYLGMIAWTLAYDTLYAIQDLNDDKKIGIKSTALLLGKHVNLFIAGCYTLFILSLLPFIHTPQGHLFLMITWGFSLYLTIAASKHHDRIDQLFVDNQWIGHFITYLLWYEMYF